VHEADAVRLEFHHQVEDGVPSLWVVSPEERKESRDRERWTLSGREKVAERVSKNN
jgi:hypothetical protein